MSMEEMAEKLSKDYRTVNNWIKELGIKLVKVKLCQNEINLELIKRIIKCLDNLGIKASCQLGHRKNDVSYFYGNPCRAKENVYLLHVFKKSVPDWIKLVGRKMLHPKKIRKMNELERLLEEEGLKRSK